MFFMAIFMLASCSPKAQDTTTRDLPIEVTPDLKFWYSETQLKNRIIIATLDKEKVIRYFINGVEYTEEGEIKKSKFKDSRMVARMTRKNYTSFTIIRLMFDPKDVKFPEKTKATSYAQFIKF